LCRVVNLIYMKAIITKIPANARITSNDGLPVSDAAAFAGVATGVVPETLAERDAAAEEAPDAALARDPVTVAVAVVEAAAAALPVGEIMGLCATLTLAVAGTEPEDTDGIAILDVNAGRVVPWAGGATSPMYAME